MARRRRGGRGGAGRQTRSSGVQVSIQGLDALRDRLEELAPTMRAACHRALVQSAEAIRDDTARAVRVDTGNLRDSVRAVTHNNQLVAEIGWWDRDDRYATVHEFGTRRIPARPALGPAAEAERARIGARIAAEVRRALG
ncbi:HK97-gp10 family putative phage morphogenesis protein [uncultured Streptomyces sp.]|uniref:HK97-gp10 family putative phage morphogenesis protein n=1 Tax=uncultured Streptomyces sp. TaxID=174707 RepID=UPI0026380F5A|nr:HK97-gp10 family putative phage morphogenesis protein [uncultured Streptomyces sp.]